MPTMLGAGNIEVPDSLDIDGVSFLPQLKGDAGSPRKWIYSWYLNPKKKEPRVFARNHQYKLYATGEFYNVPNDDQEQQSIVFDNLSDDARKVYVELQKVLSGYSKRRLDAIRKN